MIVDTHAHLCDPLFDADRAVVLARARDAGVETVVCVGESLEDARRNLSLAARYPQLLPAAGLYPGRLDPEEAEALLQFIRSERGRLAAVGEVGLDYWLVRRELPGQREPAVQRELPGQREPAVQRELPGQRELQRELFLRFVDLAVELDLPLNVHSRAAGKDVIDALLGRGARRVQLHAFDGKASTALPAVEAGYFFSIPPSVVRSRQKQKLLRHLPLECLLVESDSPVLGPETGIRNEPANTVVAVRTIAEIKSVPEQRLVGILAENAARLYRL